MLPNAKEQPYLYGIVLAIGVLVCVYLLLQSRNLIAEHRIIGRAPITRDTITIDGMGKVNAEPTLAQVDVGLMSEGRDVPTAQTENTRKMNAITAQLKSLSIDRQDIRTSNYSIQPKYEYKDGIQTIIGYTVSQNISVKVRDLSKIGTVLERSVQSGANQVNGVQFTLDDPTELQQEARKKAIEDAKQKAEALAQTLGVRIDKVVTFTEGSSNGAVPMPLYAYKAMDGAAVAPSVPEIQSGSLDVVSHVSVTFEVR